MPDTSTRLPGHGLLREGKPWTRVGSDWIEVHSGHHGRGRCSCGEASPVLSSDAARKRWHRDAHKPEVRKRMEAGNG